MIGSLERHPDETDLVVQGIPYFSLHGEDYRFYFHKALLFRRAYCSLDVTHLLRRFYFPAATNSRRVMFLGQSTVSTTDTSLRRTETTTTIQKFGLVTSRASCIFKYSLLD